MEVLVTGWPNQNRCCQSVAFLIDDGILFDWDIGGEALVETKYGGWVALGIYFLLIFLPAFYLRKRNDTELAN